MAYTTINDPSAYFHTQLYVGNNPTGQSITNDANAGDFQPDWLWIKSRSTSGGSGVNFVQDSTRGTTKDFHTSNNEAEHTNSNMLGSFDSDGFTIGSSASDNINKASDNYVAWQWKANGGTTASNSDGSITSTVQANTTAGFSIVTYTGNNSDNATVGHGLGVKPKVIIPKRRDSSGHWLINDWSGDYANKLKLNDTEAPTGSDSFVKDASSTTFTLGTDVDVNASGGTYIAYCFVEKKGYSRFGKYQGNGDNNGAFVYTGFAPGWVIIKNITDGTDDWHMFDTKRDPINRASQRLKANTNDAEGSDGALDFLSTGFKLRNTSNARNSGDDFIYMAFADHPLVTGTGTPATAR